MAVTRRLFRYIVAAPPAAHPPSWPHRLHGAPAPSALPTDAAARRNGQTCRAGVTKAYPAVYDCIDREKAGDSLLKLLGEGVNHTNTKRPGSKVCTRLGLRYTTIQLLPCYATRRSTPPTSPAASGYRISVRVGFKIGVRVRVRVRARARARVRVRV